MRNEEKVITYRCDVCAAENIKPQTVRHKELFGYRPVEPIGVEVILKGFGSYVEHICEACADKTMAAAFGKEFERNRPAYSDHAITVFAGNQPAKKCAKESVIGNEWINAIGVQYGCFQAAALRGDTKGVETALWWLREIAHPHWHEIIAALRRRPLSEEQSHGTTVKP